MKRILDVDVEIEKALSTVFDSAFKQSGMQIYGFVNQVISSIKQTEEKE